MYNFIRRWANLVESENEVREPGRRDVLCFFDGAWHDSEGNRIEISSREERNVVETISRIESKNYSSMPSLVMMDDAETLEDIADYLECDIEDVFLFFRYPRSQLSEFRSPSSEDPELSGGIYFLASLQEYDGNGTVRWTEIADISGNFESTSIFSMLMRRFFLWLKKNGVKVVASNCRTKTSDRFFGSWVFLRRFEEYGYVKLGDIDRTEEIDGETFRLNVLVDEKWWEKLSPDEKEEVVDLISTYL